MCVSAGVRLNFLRMLANADPTNELRRPVLGDERVFFFFFGELGVFLGEPNDERRYIVFILSRKEDDRGMGALDDTLPLGD